MSIHRSILLFLLFPISTVLLAAEADIILHHARIYTVDSDQSWAEAIAIKNGRISFVGSDQDVKSHQGKNTQLVDMKGKFILPSFQDVHIHPVAGGVAKTTGCPIFDMGGLKLILEKIARCVKDDSDSLHISGYGWSWDDFSEDNPPHKAMLDKIDSSRPLFFGDSDGHTLILNTAALAFAGITADTPDPEGGMIGRDPKTGELTGLLMEDSGMNLLLSKMPKITSNELKQGLLMAQSYLHSLGITAIQDAIVQVNAHNAFASLPVYKDMADSGELELRVVAALYWDPSKGMSQVAELQAARKQYSAGRLQATSVKFWADGILESYTAKMLEPYTDSPDSFGLLMVPHKQLLSATTIMDKLGFQLHIHAIGTATVRYALDAIEAAQIANGKRDARHHIAHVQLVHPDDIPRFGSLDVTANFQPFWAYGDSYVIDINAPQLGPERMEWMYPIGSIAKNGGRLAFGSDWSVSTANPFPAMEIAITRQDPETSTTEVFNPDERITLKQAIAGYTIGAAYTNFLDDDTGSIEEGKYADLIVVDRNLFEIPVSEISEANVLVTLLEGKEVFGKLSQ